MEKPLILRIALPTPLRRLFDYLPPSGQPKDLTPGVRIKVPFQSRTLVGILIEQSRDSTVPVAKLKRAIEVIDKTALFPEDIYKICLWAADYYHYALGEVLSSAMPALLRKGERIDDAKENNAMDLQINETHLLNEAQQIAVNAIHNNKNKFQVFLLDGVTGSGKTEVYLQSIAHILQTQQQVLVLVPEISLTPQTVERFRSRFNVPVVALHSNLSDRERLEAWLAAYSGKAKIVIGTRSAIFTPFSNLGLIIVDEEHDTSFKQQDRFRYHARDLAVMRANLKQIPIVLGSATPSLESILNAERERYVYLQLPQRAGDAQLPQYQLLDVRHLALEEGISQPLLESIRAHLAANNQVLLFLNRRGFAPVLYCTQCAWIAKCNRCDMRLVYHRKPERLQCHHCDKRIEIPTCCAECKAENLEPIGIGTQRLEQMLSQHFPDIPIIRVDRDSTRRKDALNNLLEKINTENKAILLGTQMLAKGHHFPNVTLVGMIDADGGLFSADFRAAEQMGQLLLQVAGRAGRAEKPGTVILQTRHPDHPLLNTLLNEGYSAFAKLLLKEREQISLPPYTYFAVFKAESYTEQTANDFLLNIKSLCEKLPMNAVNISGPVPALIAKRKGLHCQHLLLRSNQRSVLQSLLKNCLQQIEKLGLSQSVKWILDVDPVEV